MKNIKLLLYCCKDKRGYLHFDTRPEITRKYYLSPDSSPFGTYEPDNYLNGKILAECDYEVEEIFYSDESDIFWTKTLLEEELCKRSCLSQEDLTKYLILKDSYSGNSGYAIHIKNLNIFDKPRELWRYENQKIRVIKEAPQNMMYAYEILTGAKYILISIRPEWMCLILNKDKDVEVRKRVLKEMI